MSRVQRGQAGREGELMIEALTAVSAHGPQQTRAVRCPGPTQRHALPGRRNFRLPPGCRGRPLPHPEAEVRRLLPAGPLSAAWPATRRRNGTWTPLVAGLVPAAAKGAETQP